MIHQLRWGGEGREEEEEEEEEEQGGGAGGGEGWDLVAEFLEFCHEEPVHVVRMGVEAPRQVQPVDRRGREQSGPR